MMNLRWGAASAVFLLLPLLGHGQSAYGQANLIATAPTVLAECDFDSSQPSVTVPFTVDGKRLAFALATHDHTLLGSSFVTTLKRMPAAFAAAAPDAEDFAMRRAPRVSVGQVMLQFPFDAVRCGKLIYFGSHLNSGAGVIGLDALIQHVIEIDFDTSKIRILQSVTETAGERFEITSWREEPRRCAVAINARCGDEPEEEFFVELESPHGIYLNGALYRQLVSENDMRRVHIESAGGGEDSDFCFAGTLSRFQLGRLETRNAHAILNGKNAIGLNFLSRFIVTFDFPHGLMYLRPGKQFQRVDELDVSGIIGRCTDGGLILECDPRPGAAAELVLKRGDRIVEVDGISVSKANLASVHRKLRQEGSTVHIRYLRGENEKTVDLKLKANQQMFLRETDLVTGPVGMRVIDIPVRPEPPPLTEFVDIR